MPVWLQAILALSSTFGLGSFLLEMARRRNERKDRTKKGDATITVRQIDDGAAQRGELWEQFEVLRKRLDEQEAKTERIKLSLAKLWTYAIKLQVAFDAAAATLTELGHPVPISPPKPPTAEEVFDFD